MNASFDCVRCFFRQALAAAKIAGADEDQQYQVLDALSDEFPHYSFDVSPAEMARNVYGVVCRVLNCDRDIYKEIKAHSNKMALSLYDDLKQTVNNSSDSLLTAVEMALAGNIIDYGAKNELNIEAEIAMLMQNVTGFINSKNKKHFNYKELYEMTCTASHILYIGDNAGEVLFDRVLIEEIMSLNPNVKITYAVRAKPIINDATMEDAYVCGIDKSAEIMSSGCDTPGAVLASCSSDFMRLYQSVDFIVSKGQGNFEALSAESRPIFFMFMVKCHVAAREVNGSVGDIVLLYNKLREQ